MINAQLQCVPLSRYYLTSETPVLRIRLQRTGRKKIPFYRVVVAEHSAPIQGRIVDRIGSYNPLVKPWSLEVDENKVIEWIKKGASPTNTVARLLKANGMKDMEKFIVEMKDRKKKKAEEEKKEMPKEEAPAEEVKEEEKPAEETPAEETKEEEASAEEVKEEEKSQEKDDKEEK